MPATTEPPTPAQPPAAASMCLRHGDFHVMDSDCWGVTFEWLLNHDHLPEPVRRDAYLLEVEQAMLDQHIRAHRAGLPGGDR
ncbi:hypothetical protein [Streptomyces sp. NPDC060001]|uniref:hypothetical protein n=1 Tax=Streptomyces sp. NPDC060001 TaxID=3347032 RepID=UPI0036B1AF7B